MTAVEDIVLNQVFQGQEDRFHGITVDSSKEPCDVSVFPKKLEGTVLCIHLDRMFTESPYHNKFVYPVHCQRPRSYFHCHVTTLVQIN